MVEDKPVPIKNGKFTFERTTHSKVTGNVGSGTFTTKVSGVFKSASKGVVELSSKVFLEYPEGFLPTGTTLDCEGNYIFVTLHK